MDDKRPFKRVDGGGQTLKRNECGFPECKIKESQ